MQFVCSLQKIYHYENTTPVVKHKAFGSIMLWEAQPNFITTCERLQKG